MTRDVSNAEKIRLNFERFYSAYPDEIQHCNSKMEQTCSLLPSTDKQLPMALDSVKHTLLNTQLINYVRLYGPTENLIKGTLLGN